MSNNTLMLLRPLIDALQVPDLAPAAFESLSPAIPALLENMAAAMSKAEDFEGRNREFEELVRVLKNDAAYYEEESDRQERQVQKWKKLVLHTLTILKPFVRCPVRVTPKGKSKVEGGIFEGQALILTDKNEIELRLVDGRSIPLDWISKPSLEGVPT